MASLGHDELTFWGRLTDICVSKLTVIGSDNGLSPHRRQAIIWTNAGLLLIGPSGMKFSEILIEIVRVSFKKMRLKGSSAKWRPFCLGLNVLSQVAAPAMAAMGMPQWVYQAAQYGDISWHLIDHSTPLVLKQLCQYRGRYRDCWYPGSLRRQI